jgi:hypothetical protein
VIPPDIRRTPGTVPTKPFGLGNDDFNAGKKVSKFGYPVLELYELVRPVTAGEMKTKWEIGPVLADGVVGGSVEVCGR